MKHLLRFYSGEGKPTLLFREGGKVAGLELSGKQDIGFSGRASCIGYRTPHGYCECRNGAINVRQCPLCSRLDMSRAYTVGDFAGFPELYEKAKLEEYCLYLAGFGEDLVKCGVTRKERFEMRMREQGADFGCIVGAFLGPDAIYRAEEELQSRFSLRNSVRMAEKIRRLVFDRKAASENFSTAVEAVRSSGVLPDFSPRVQDFSSCYPPIHSPRASDAVQGRVLGAKGEILLFSPEGGGECALNMRAKTGHFFETR